MEPPKGRTETEMVTEKWTDGRTVAKTNKRSDRGTHSDEETEMNNYDDRRSSSDEAADARGPTRHSRRQIDDGRGRIDGQRRMETNDGQTTRAAGMASQWPKRLSEWLERH